MIRGQKRLGAASTLQRFNVGAAELPADENQNAGGQRKNSGHDHRDADVKESHDPNKDQINRQQEHSEVFSDNHASLLRQVRRVCTLKISCLTTEDTEDADIVCGFPFCSP